MTGALPLSRRAAARLRACAAMLGLSVLSAQPALAGKATLVLTPGPGQLGIGRTTTWQATLTGAKKDVVLWSVCDGRHKKCLANGSAATGRIFETGGSSGGVHTAEYSAPGATPAPPLCTPASGGCRISIRAQAKGAPKLYADLVIGDFLRVESASLPAGFSGEPYDAPLQAAGGVPPYSWSLTATPAGLTIDPSTGTISGTLPALPASGSYAIGVQVSDSTVPPQSAQATLTLDVAPLLDPSLSILSPHDGVVGAQYTLVAHVSGGRPPLFASVSGGSPPPGLSLVFSGLPDILLTGAPSQSGDYVVTLDLSDSSLPPRTGTAQISVTIHDALAITTTSLPAGLRDEPYSATVLATGGTPPYAFSLNTGLPLGLSLDGSTGVVSGTPLRVFNGSIYLSLTDSSQPPQVTSGTMTLSITGPLKFLSTSPVAGVFGQNYASNLQLDGGKSPFIFELAGGTLPPGISMQPFGTSLALGGLPVGSGTFDFLVQVTDTAIPPVVITDSFTMFVRSAPLGIASSLLPSGTVGVPYSTFLAADAGIPPLQWSLSGGSLPPGLSLDPLTGEIAGIPVTAGSSGFDAHLSDSVPPASLDRAFLLKVHPSPPGRNDSIATATPLAAGGYQGLSLSAPGDTADTDYYELTADAGSIVIVQTAASALTIPYPTDTVIEILRADGTRYTTCMNPGLDDGVTGAPDPTPFDFDDECLNDDISLAGASDSQLSFEVPGNGVVTFYLHVLDYHGSSRPDLLYDLAVAGAH